MLQVLRNGGSIPLFTLVKGFHNNKFSIDVLLRGINFNASLKNVDALSWNGESISQLESIKVIMKAINLEAS